MMATRTKTVRSVLLLITTALVALALAALPQTQAHAELAAGTAQLEAQSADLYITSPSSTDDFVAGDTVYVRAYTGIYFFQYGYAASNYITFKVTHNGSVVYYGSDYYNGAGDYCGISFEAKKVGKYKIEMSGSHFSQMSEESFEATDSVTITVKDASAIVKSLVKEATPTYTNVSRYKKSRVKVTWDGMYGWDDRFTGAKVYRATSPEGPYKLRATAKGTSYIDKVNKKTDYYYKIKYYFKKGSKVTTSSFSEPEGAFVNAPEAPVIKSAKKVKRGAKITWKLKGGSTAVLIYRATKKKGTYKFIDGFNGSIGKKSYVDKTAKAGKTYWYKVEAKRWMDWKDDGAYAKSKPVKVKL